MSAPARRHWKAAVGALLLLLIVLRVGTGPFLAALRGLDPPLLALGLVIGAGVTTSCAWRWRLVARAVGVPLSMRSATTACYRAQFLNNVLAGGVLGDVERGLRHGTTVLDRRSALRAVVWERSSGQALQIGVTLVLVAFLPSPLGTVGPALLAGVLLLAVVAGVLVRLLGPEVRVRAEAAAVLGRRTLPGVLGSSLLATTGHVALFVVAARAVGVTAPISVLVPSALLVLVAMVVPIGLGGWGAREGAAAWAFAAGGLDIGQGVATAVVFGVLSFAGSLPGLVPLLAGRVGPPARWRGTTPVRGR